MENILIEKAENGFIVREDFDNRNPMLSSSMGKILVFQTKRALNKYINKRFDFNENSELLK